MQRISLFSRVQSWFSGSFHGRYLALILAEIGKHHPMVVTALLCHAFDWNKRSLPRPVFAPEYSFQGIGGGRRSADLAVFARADDEEPVALIEIKYRDKLLPESGDKAAQLDDYIAWKSSKPGRHCLILSRETLRIDGVATMTWTQAAQRLRRSSKKSDLVEALIEHLEEEGIVMQNIDPKALIGFIKRLVCPINGAGGQQAGNLSGPQEFGKLLLNVKLLSNRFNGDFKEAWTQAGIKVSEASASGTKGATIDFEVMGRLKGAVDRLVDPDDGTINGAARAGGSVLVFARHSLGSGKGWLRVGYGLWIDVDGSVSHEKGRHPESWVYAWAHSDEFRAAPLESQHRLRSFDLITSKAEDSVDKLEQLVRKQLHSVLSDLLLRSASISAKQRKAAKTLLSSFSERTAA